MPWQARSCSTRCATESLELLVAQGLSGEGRKHLATIRKGAGWPIPLHALINHKAYIIDRPRDHKFIPELVGREEVPAVANLAVIPLYHEETRVGVFLAIGGRLPINELQIMEHVAALDALAAAIVPSRGGTTAAPPLRAVPTPTPPKSATPRAEPSRDTHDTTERQSGALRVEVDELRASHQKELDTVRAAHEREVTELRATLQTESETARAAHAREITELRATLQTESETARAAHEQEITELRVSLQKEAEAARAPQEEYLDALRASLQQELDSARAAHAREADLRATLQGEIEALQATHREATAQAAAAAVLAEKRAADERAEAEVALGRLRTTLGDRDATVAEHDRRLAELTAERDRAHAAAGDAEKANESLREELATSKGEVATLRERNGALETQVGRLDQQVASLTSERGALVERLAAADADPRAEKSANTGSVAASASTVHPVPTKVDPPAVTVDSQSVSVLDADPEQRERIAAALKGKHALRDRRLVVANLFAVTADQIAELTRAMDDGVTVIGYASDGKRRSCVLGPLRLLGGPPSSVESAVALPRPIAGARRILTLSGDVDAFREANGVLAGAGHSVSMACDARQATELFSVINPDTVMIDLRGVPEAGGEFLSTLGPEAGAGRMLKVFICGDPVTSTLARALERVLRPLSLDAVSLAQLCVDVFREPAPSPGGRPFQHTIPMPKKVGRRQ